MRVRVCQTVEVTDAVRRKMRAYYGDKGLASRDEVKRWIIAFGGTMDDELAEVSEDGDRE